MRKIHYKFEVDFIDAENISHSFRNEICRLLKNARKSYIAGNKAESDWYDRHATYLEKLIDKMSHEVDHERKVVCFDFIVDAIDSENIYDIIKKEKIDLYEDIMEEMIGENRPKYIELHKDRQKYVDELLGIMTRELVIGSD